MVKKNHKLFELFKTIATKYKGLESLLIVLTVTVLIFVGNKIHPYTILAIAAGATGISVTLYNPVYLWQIGIMLMPIAINLEELTGSLALSVPSDLIAFGLFIFFFLRPNNHFQQLGDTIKHPIFLSLLLYLGWMLCSICTSTMPVTSAKYWLSSMWYFTAFFLISIILFLEDPERIKKWLFLLAPTLIFVVGFTLYKHSKAGFAFRDSFTVMEPFYKEHTAYAASIAIPTVGFLANLIYGKKLKLTTFYIFLLFLVLITGVITSYTRGAWLGIIGAIVVIILIEIWIRYRYFFIISSIVAILIGIISFNVRMSYDQDSDKSKSFKEHITSVFNTKTDLSNQERINRWVASIEMYIEEPVTGFGPGTFAMQYAPYQKSKYKTYVSTNRGDMGTAHNEFLLAASEMGTPGVLNIILIFGSCLFCGIRGCIKTKDVETKKLYVIALSGLITYFVHSLVNNFLDQDKVAIPIYLCMAQIVALDILKKKPISPPSNSWK